MALELLEYFGISIASAVVLILLAKFVLQHLIRKAPDYYDKRERRDEATAVANFGKAGEHEHHEPVAESSAVTEPEPVSAVKTEPKTEKAEEEPGTDKKPAAKKSSTKKTENKKSTTNNTSSNKTDKSAKKGRKPSMNMRKDELIAAAKEREIELPDKITKAQILELIKQSENKE